MHPNRNGAAFNLNLEGGRVMPGVRPTLKTMTARILLTVFLLFVLLTALGCERKLVVEEKDKPLLLRAQDLAVYGFEFDGAEKYESFAKARIVDGSYDIEYEFRTPEGEQNQPLFLYVLVNVGGKKSDAVISRGAEKLALLYGFKAKGIEEEEVKDFYRYGDSSSFYILKKEGKPIGNYFTVREGSKVYSLILSGMYIDDPKVWKEIIEPKLKYFSAYAPA